MRAPTPLRKPPFRLEAALALCALTVLPAVCSREAPPEEVELNRSALTISEWAPNQAYGVGDLVTFNGITFRCRQAHTSQLGWEPPKVPALWERPGPAGIQPWTNQTDYVVGSGVTFDGLVYRCLQAHVSQPDWTPPVTPALWKVTGNVLIPPGLSGSLELVFKSRNLPAGIQDGFGLIHRDPWGDPAFTELLDSGQRTVGEVFHRISVQGGEIFEFYLQANKGGATSSPSMSPATYSSDPTMNMDVDPTFPDHVAQPLQTAAQKASNIWSLRWESFKFGDAGRDGKFDDLTVELRLGPPCNNTTVVCRDPNLVVSRHLSSSVDYRGDVPTPIGPPAPDILAGPLKDPAAGEGNAVPIGTAVLVGGRIDTLRWSFVQEATDFSAATPAETLSCKECAPVSPALIGGGLWSLEIKRIHRPRGEPAVSSFGPGVFSNFDSKLTLVPGALGNQNTAVLFDPMSDAPPVTFFERSRQDGDNATDGRYHDNATRMYAGLVLFNASGAVEPNPTSARTAVVTRHSGESLKYEIINTQGAGASQRQARLIAVQDRNGNAASISYQFPASASDSQLGGDRKKLWLINQAKDPHGVAASFSYQLRSGTSRWVVTSIALPDATTVTYQYGTDPANLDRLVKVVYANGDASTFSRAWDAASQTWALAFKEAGTGDVRSWKTVHVTAATFTTPDNVVHNQEPNLVRRVVNASGEQVYSAIEDPNDPDSTYYREAGIRLTRLRVDPTGLPRQVARATNQAADPLLASYQVVQSYAGDALEMVQKATDAFGNVRSFERDSLTRAVTRVVARGGTSADFVRNAFLQPTRTTDRLGRKTTSSYDSKGNVLAITHAAGTSAQAAWTFAYNAKGQVTRATDANGKAKDYAYNASGFLTSITEPPDVSGGSRPVRAFETSALGRLTAMIDASGRRVTFAYDNRGRLKTKTYPGPTTDSFGYGSGATAGLLVAATDRNGMVEQYEYDDTRRPARVVHAAGRPEGVDTTFAYLPGTELIATQVTSGERVEFGYDERLRPTSRRTFLNASGVLVSQNRWDALDRNTLTTDPYGRRSFRLFDQNGRLVRTVTELVAGGVPSETELSTLPRVTTGNPPYLIEDTAYDAMGQTTSTTDVRGFVTANAYDGQGRLTSTIRAAGTPGQRKTTYAYDAFGNLITETHPRTFTEGQTFKTTYTYTGRNQIATRTEGSGSADAATTTYTYSPTNKVLTVKDPNGGVTTNGYDACCDRLTSIKDAAGFTTTNSYDGVGNRTATRNPLGATRSFAYDGLDRLLSETNPLGQVSRRVYDDDLTDGVGLDATYEALISYLGFGASTDGSAIESTNAANEKTLVVYDGLQRPLLEMNAAGHVLSRSYDTIVAGLVETATLDPVGNVTSRRADGAGRVRVRLDGAGKTSTEAFDPQGSSVSLRDPNGVGRDCQYDAFGGQIGCTDTHGDSTTRVYDAGGNQVRLTDRNGVQSTCAFDFLDRKQSCVDRLGGVTRFAYDRKSNTTALTDAEGKITRYTYDPRDLRLTETYPDSTGPTDRVSRAYDGAGRLIRRTDQGGNALTFEYDAADRLVKKTDAAGKVDAYTVDAIGRITAGTSQRYGTSMGRSFDGGGHLVAETLSLASPAETFTVRYAYDDNDRLSVLTYPDGTVASSTYTNRNQLASIALPAQPIAQLAYDDGGRRTKTTLGNGLVETRSYRNDNTLASMATPAVGTITHSYDGEKRKLTEAGTAINGDQSFEYDREGRLTSWSNGSDSQSWVLTLVGDWLRTTRGEDTETRVHNAAHELTRLDAVPLSYDARGNIIANHLGDAFTWDFENKLQAFDPGSEGGSSAAYLYDVLGRRVARTVGGVRTVFVPSNQEVASEYVGGVLARNYVLGAELDRPFAYTSGGATYWYSANRVGSIVAVTSSAGAVAERYRYTAYGERAVLSPAGAPLPASAVGNQVGFTGRYHDEPSGLIDFRFRLYDPFLGRFISRDDDYHDGLSLYAATFVPNSTDPTGHFRAELGDPNVPVVSTLTARILPGVPSPTSFASGLFKYFLTPGKIIDGMDALSAQPRDGGFGRTGGMMLAMADGGALNTVDCDGFVDPPQPDFFRSAVRVRGGFHCYVAPFHIPTPFSKKVAAADVELDVVLTRLDLPITSPPVHVPFVNVSDTEVFAWGDCQGDDEMYHGFITFHIFGAPGDVVVDGEGHGAGEKRNVKCKMAPQPPPMPVPEPPGLPPNVAEVDGGGPIIVVVGPSITVGPTGIEVGTGGDDGCTGLCDQEGFIVPCAMLTGRGPCSSADEEDNDEDGDGIITIRGSGS